MYQTQPVVMAAAAPGEKPPRFYLKKWLIAIVTIVRVLYGIFGLVGLIIVLSVGNTNASSHVDKDTWNTVTTVCIVMIVIIVLFTMFELTGAIGALKESLTLTRIYLIYCVANLVIWLVVRIALLATLNSKAQETVPGVNFVRIIFDAIFAGLFALLVLYFLRDLKTIERQYPKRGVGVSPAGFEEAAALNR